MKYSNFSTSVTTLLWKLRLELQRGKPFTIINFRERKSSLTWKIFGILTFHFSNSQIRRDVESKDVELSFALIWYWIFQFSHFLLREMEKHEGVWKFQNDRVLYFLRFEHNKQQRKHSSEHHRFIAKKRVENFVFSLFLSTSSIISQDYILSCHGKHLRHIKSIFFISACFLWFSH